MKSVHIIFLLLLLPLDLLACRCAGMSLEDELDNANYVFVSTVVSKEHKSVQMSKNGYLYKHEVKKILKGKLASIIYSFTPKEMTSCDVAPDIGQELVLIVKGESPFNLGGCQMGGDRKIFETMYPNWMSSFNREMSESQ